VLTLDRREGFRIGETFWGVSEAVHNDRPHHQWPSQGAATDFINTHDWTSA
jgi:hypothetical protein